MAKIVEDIPVVSRGAAPKPQTVETLKLAIGNRGKWVEVDPEKDSKTNELVPSARRQQSYSRLGVETAVRGDVLYVRINEGTDTAQVEAILARAEAKAAGTNEQPKPSAAAKRS